MTEWNFIDVVYLLNVWQLTYKPFHVLKHENRISQQFHTHVVKNQRLFSAIKFSIQMSNADFWFFMISIFLWVSISISNGFYPYLKSISIFNPLSIYRSHWYSICKNATVSSPLPLEGPVYRFSNVLCTLVLWPWTNHNPAAISNGNATCSQNVRNRNDKTFLKYIEWFSIIYSVRNIYN